MTDSYTTNRISSNDVSEPFTPLDDDVFDTFGQAEDLSFESLLSQILTASGGDVHYRLGALSRLLKPIIAERKQVRILRQEASRWIEKWDHFEQYYDIPKGTAPGIPNQSSKPLAVPICQTVMPIDGNSLIVSLYLLVANG